MVHVHADLIKLYAQQLIAWVEAGADVEKHPAKDWECHSSAWYRFKAGDNLSFMDHCQYHYNPLPKTVTRYSNDGTQIVLPEPCNEKLEVYWYISVNGSVHEMTHTASDDDMYFRVGNYYRTEFDAEQWARYLKHVCTGEPMEKAND